MNKKYPPKIGERPPAGDFGEPLEAKGAERRDEHHRVADAQRQQVDVDQLGAHCPAREHPDLGQKQV